MAVLGWTVRPSSATRLVRNHPLVVGLNNAWVPYSVVQTPNLVNGPPLLVGGATAATVQSGALGSGAGKTADGFTNLFTSTSTAAWSTAIGVFRLRGTNAGVPLFGNNSQGSAIYTNASGQLALFVSSGNRLNGATVIGATDTFVVGYRNDANNGYELYLNGLRDDAGGVTGWGNINPLTAIGTAGTSFSVAVDFFGLFTWDRFLTPAEHFAFARNPWQIIAQAPRAPWVAVAGGGGATIAVPAGSLVLTGFAPTIATTANQTVAVPAGSLVLNGFAPTVSASGNQSIAVPAGSLVLTGVAPTILNPVGVAVPAGSLVLTGFAPTVSVAANQTVQVPAGSLTLTGIAPTVNATANQAIAVPAGSLVLTGIAPTVQVAGAATIDVPAASLTLTGYAPTVDTGAVQRFGTSGSKKSRHRIKESLPPAPERRPFPHAAPWSQAAPKEAIPPPWVKAKEPRKVARALEQTAKVELAVPDDDPRALAALAVALHGELDRRAVRAADEARQRQLLEYVIEHRRQVKAAAVRKKRMAAILLLMAH